VDRGTIGRHEKKAGAMQVRDPHRHLSDNVLSLRLNASQRAFAPASAAEGELAAAP
jgi:hypothetical protein